MAKSTEQTDKRGYPSKYSPEKFLNRQSSELQKIIAPLSNECIQDLGPFWENVKDK